MKSSSEGVHRCYLAVGSIVITMPSYGFNAASAKSNAIARCNRTYPLLPVRFLGMQSQVSRTTVHAAISFNALKSGLGA